MNFSSNINEVVRAVLNFLFFLKKDFTGTKKHWKAPKAQKNTKTQPSKSKKVTYLLCVFCAREEKKIEKMKSLYNVI